MIDFFSGMDVLRRLAGVTAAVLTVLWTAGMCCAAAKYPLGLRSHYASLTALPGIDGIEIVRSFPHDPQSYTQGLFFHKGFLVESAGLYGKSSLRKIDLKTGRMIKELKLDGRYFGEGCALLKARIYQLTWKEETGFIYDLKTFKKIGRFAYRGEGWGLTTDGRYLIMSNGSSIITFRQPDSFAVVRSINVHDGRQPVASLNELEYIKGEIWANIYMENAIVRISPQDGAVLGWIDLSPLMGKLASRGEIDVLNGIAYDEKNNRIFVTGKLWPLLFEIKVTGN